VIFEGDIFHYREAVNVRVQNEALDIFTSIAKKFKRGVFAITGNHDTYYKDKSEVHSLRAIRNLASNIHIFENPEILTINETHSFLMIPWVEDGQKLVNLLEDHRSFCSYVICHADIIGFKFNKWVAIEKGLDPEKVSKYKRVYSGHIHIRQEKNNILYTGSPYQMDRGDIGNTKGFYKLTVESSELIETFVRNTYSPVFLKYDMLDLLELPVKTILETFKNNFIDVMINVNFASKLSIPMFLEELSRSTHRKIEFFTYSDQEKADLSLTSDFNPDDGFNLTDIFKLYLKSKDYPLAFKKKLATKFLDIHREIKQEKSYA
jgi:DNA repair exonuclease SbcCD nuclease subunit